jgi:hypothetical protein
MAYLYASMPARSTFVEDAHVNSHYIQLTPRYGYDANRATERSLQLRTEDQYQ